MEICSVTLNNFKIHVNQCYEFRPGTNAICGENGAGKTSILEAIAWVLFDHSDYTRGELIRMGAKSAQVTVSFISSLDGRVYEARRCTSKGYDLIDPQINVNLGLRKIEDVQAWMRQHLGVPPQMDLARLFAETIGIPQGTFTTDFLKRPNDRKKIFDPILKVEEYRQTYDQMRDLETYAKAEVSTLAQRLASYEQQLASREALQEQATVLRADVLREEAQIEQMAQEVSQRQTEADRLIAEVQQVQILEARCQQLEAQLAGKAEYLHRLEADCLSAQKAVELCRAKRPNFQAYEAAQEALKDLAEQRRQQQTALKQRDELRNRLRDREVEVSQLQGQLAAFTELRQDQGRWQALVPRQDQLEQQLQQLQQALLGLEPIQLTKQMLAAQLAQRQALRSHLHEDIEALKAVLPQVEALPLLEQEHQRMLACQSQARAGQAFAGELQPLVNQAQINRDRYLKQVPLAQQMLTPLMASRPDLAFVQQVLKAGTALNDEMVRSLQALLQTLIDPATTFDDQLQAMAEQIQALRSLQQRIAILPHKQQQSAECDRELAQLQQQDIECDRQLARRPALQEQYVQLEHELKQLNDPKGNLRLLAQQLQQAQKIQEQLTKIQTSLALLQPEIVQKEQLLAVFEGLGEQFEVQQQILTVCQTDHQQYLRNREQANKFRELNPLRVEAQAALVSLQADVQQANVQLQQTQQSHDAQQLPILLQALEQLKQQRDHLQGGLQPKRIQLQDFDQRLEALQAIALQQECDRLAIVQKQQVLQFVSDARSIFNQSGPRITRYYLAEVSHEAEKLYRELLNRDEVTLRWTEDYEIQIQAHGYWQSFRSLSGGEQMCAALAVRLALLRVLADVDIAFFDEPTTNMDQVRRQQLAEAISNLKAFRQLIVISHDDTFENVTEHIIRIER
jgi:DNA repair protein SbcC/Rad50